VGRFLIIGLAIAGAVVVAEVATSGGGSESARPAPALPTEVLVGPKVTLQSLRGKPALVNFWASWCTPCRKEAPELERLAASLGDRGRLVGVDWADSARNARAFAESHHWTYPNLRDADGGTGDRYRLTGLPTTFVLDAEGRIRQTLRGPQTTAGFSKALADVGAE
jgi:cytochrome c biogenesis protein CcmG/thiol:disulfide interchange protein DsbE